MIQQGRLSCQFHKLPQLSGCPALWNYIHLDRSLIDHLIGELISNLTINKDDQSVKAHVYASHITCTDFPIKMGTNCNSFKT